MIEIKKENCTIITPDNFDKVELLFFKEWYDDLMKNPKQCAGQLKKGNSHCCLGRLCIVQGRLDKEGRDVTSRELEEYRKSFYLDEHGLELSSLNPCYDILNSLGNFPVGCYIRSKYTGNKLLTFSQANDKGCLNMIDIAGILDAFYKPVQLTENT